MKKIFSIVILLLLLGGMGIPVHGQAIVPEPKGITYTPEVPLPGIFDKPVSVDDQLLATYLRAVYVYFIWIVGIMATIMVIYGGVRWVAAAGNPSRINQARETINNAIIGVIIALTSVVLLNIIDPAYTRFGLPNISPVKQQEFGDAVVKNQDGSCKTSREIPCGLVCTDSKATTYGDCSYCDSTRADKDKNLCGTGQLDPSIPDSEGNCQYTRCPESDQVCEKVPNSLTQGLGCSAEARLPRLSEAGYGDLPESYSDKYDCGGVWWEKGAFLDPEELNVGRKCPSGQYCVVDYTVAVSISVAKSAIPSDKNAYQIGQFNNSGCH